MPQAKKNVTDMEIQLNTDFFNCVHYLIFQLKRAQGLNMKFIACSFDQELCIAAGPEACLGGTQGESLN